MSTASASSGTAPASTPAGHVDVLIVGAGLSGIGVACRLESEAPAISYAILEARGTSGGTWDLFRFPGVRSDSDMFTLSFPFKPWKSPKTIAGGSEILAYLRETAAEYGVDEKITYHRKVVGADWSSAEARWTVTVEDTQTGALSTRTCWFLYVCAGYYRYDEGYTPDWPTLERFAGVVAHPQFWPDDLDLTGKRVVLIGSGATAATILPAIAGTAAKVTMLQRSPSFIMSMPNADPIGDLLRKLLPQRRAYAAIRWKNARTAIFIYGFCRKYPARARRMLQNGAARQLPEGYDIATHFTPAYEPWDQRMCLVPDGDFFAAIKRGDADVVTGHIEEFTPEGIKLRSGAELEADVIITATGLNLLPLGGLGLKVDGAQAPVPERVAYKGMMLDGIPNLAFAIGYTNASWTLKVDLVASYVVRVLLLMRAQGFAVVTPRLPAEGLATSPFIDMSSGYFERSRASLPLQGDRAPWRLWQQYFKDATLFKGPVDQKNLEYSRAPELVKSAR
ncbi:MAG TPA: NAD(P)/FAD-dependent oxidoreductase [Streptosporangiaceae bacterium]|nr:NAD(P)/FAD-dependent oxidoreductase [Streptosporangiaceae bacterium]